MLENAGRNASLFHVSEGTTIQGSLSGGVVDVFPLSRSPSAASR